MKCCMTSLCSFFVLFLMSIVPVFASTQTLTTYYPAPQGNYKNVSVGNQLQMQPTAACTATATANEVTLVDAGGVLEWCDSNGGPYSIYSSGLWTGNGTYLYPTSFSQHVAIGANTDPGLALGVTGDAKVTGNTVLGTTGNPSGGAGNTLTVNANPTVNGLTTINAEVVINGPAGGGVGIHGSTWLDGGGGTGAGVGTNIWGPLTIGNGFISASTVTLNGDLIVQNSTNGIAINNAPLTVSGVSNLQGNTTLGTAAANSVTVNGTTTFNAQANMNAPAGTSSGIYICSGGNCGYFQVAYDAGSGKYYAAYGP